MKVYGLASAPQNRAHDNGDARQSEFLSTMGHEIRTPLSGVIGLAHLLTETDLSELQMEYVGAITACADSLLEVINEILDFSQIEAGKVSITEEPFNLLELVEDVCLRLSQRASDAKLYLKIGEGDAIERLCGDPTRIRQVINNLVDNAVKFTREGGVTVRILSRPPRNGKVRFRVAIEDTGPGIGREQVSSLFTAFETKSEDEELPETGIGLGLTIAKKLVEFMGGTLGLESRVGAGSCLWFELELEKAEALEAKIGESLARPGTDRSLVGMSILVAEDDPVSRLVAVRSLERLGCRIAVCENGHQAVESLKRQPADLVLMDCEMPELNGYQATEMIRLHERMKGLHTPIIAMTANAMAGDRKRCLDAGMDDYLSKPVKPNELLDLLNRYRNVSDLAA